MSTHRRQSDAPKKDLVRASSPRRAFQRSQFRQFCLAASLLFIALFVNIVGQLSIPYHAQAATLANLKPPAAANLTLSKALQQGNSNKDNGLFKFPTKTTPVPGAKPAPSTAKSLPSAEPAKMKALSVTLDSSIVTAMPTKMATSTSSSQPTSISTVSPASSKGQTNGPLDLLGSDGRFEVKIPRNALDLSQTTLTKGAAPTAPFTFTLTQEHGNFAGQVSLLGYYQVKILDAKGQQLQKVRLRKPLTFIYHYKPGEMSGLGLNPDHLVLTWPDDLAVVRKNAQLTQKQPNTQIPTPASPYLIPLKNDPKTNTLTAQTTVLGAGALAVGGDNPDNQSPFTPHFASVGGNSGQLNYTYPLQVAPGPPGTTPTLNLSYSSSDSNERHNRTSPANNVGEGWSLSMGSISAEDYPSTSAQAGTWYFISGVANVSDRLIPDSSGTNYATEHISYLKIHRDTLNGQPCFHVWDTAGNFYSFGCTSDSLQYRTDSTGRHNYRWDLDNVIPANEGQGTANRSINISYLQDMVTTSGYTSVRDAVLKQITYGANSQIAGTVDFSYKAPFSSTTWASAYGTNYNCSSSPPISTTLRCDDPLDHTNGLNAPTVMSTFSLQTVTSYVGTDSGNKYDSYAFNYQDSPFSQCWDDYTGVQDYCAGEHLLTKITPTIYHNGQGTPLQPLELGYTSPQAVTYRDLTQTTQSGTQNYTITTYWQYLNAYYDTRLGTSGTVNYALAYSNTHGTPNATDGSGNIIDDRHDPLYCSTHTDCTGVYDHPDDRNWSVLVVTFLQVLGADSGGESIAPTTSYHYRLAAVNSGCPAAGSDTDCVADNWTPTFTNGTQTDNDWMDYYHSEFHGFNVVYTTSPAQNLTVDYYYSTEGWNTVQGHAGNYLSGSMYQEDIYQGNQVDDSQLLRRTVNNYAGANGTYNACNGNFSGTYTPCETMVLSSRTTTYDGTGSSNTNAPWVEHDYTYDDYNGGGLAAGYHNLLKEVVSSSNSSTVATNKWTYQPTDTVYNGWTFYNVHKVKSSEVDDNTGHVWKCQDVVYDEGAASGVPIPSAGWVTTTHTYSNCANKTSATTSTSYTGYDQYGNLAATVDAFGVANQSLYSSTGCSTSPAYKSGAWTAGHYTTCTSYDSSATFPTKTTNVLNQSSSIGYDFAQGGAPTSATDLNNQTTTTGYNYSSSGTGTQTKLPGETNTYSAQEIPSSSCIDDINAPSTMPCFEIDNNNSLYPGAVKRTFYDSQGRATETRTPLDATHDIIAFIVYDETDNQIIQSKPFRVAAGTAWLDPNGAIDDTGVQPGVTVKAMDALGRVIGIKDPLLGSSAEAGVGCYNAYGVDTSNILSGNWTICTGYHLSSPNGDTQVYESTNTIDADKHVKEQFSDSLGRVRYVQLDGLQRDRYCSFTCGYHAAPEAKRETQYNALNDPTSVIVTDLAPQSGQTITQVTTSATYDDMGRLTSVNDPDRGNHTYTYDANGRLITDVSGSRTIGTSYDLLGRAVCLQDAAPTTNGSGNCSSGSHPLVQNTYDTSKIGTQGSSDFSIGLMTQSVATTYYPDGTSATTTQQFQHDLRGRVVTTNLQVAVPSSWNVTTTLPTYQSTIAYNDANQATTTQTRIGSLVGYTFTQAYDSTTGQLTGLSNNSTGVANLATFGFNTQGQISDLNFQTATGTALVNDHFAFDGDLRPASTTATWQSGSGSSGTIFGDSLTYDSIGNVISKTTVQAAVPGQSNSGGSQTQNFCYDSLNQLTWAGNSGIEPTPALDGSCGSATLSNTLGGSSYNVNYAYTNLGQLWQGPLNGVGTQQQYLYCDSTHPHQLTGLYPLGTTCSSLTGSTYTSQYDIWGNVTNRTYNSVNAALSYDKLDHLVQWNAGSNNQEWYVYDSSGERVLRRNIAPSNTTLTVYAFGLEEHVYDGSGNVQGNTYYYFLGSSLIGKFDGTNTQFFLTDAQGSVLATFNNVAGSASVQGNQVYAPYGYQLNSSGSMGTAKGYTGQYQDLTGLDYYNARYYDPVVGRFLSADTVQGNMQGLDPYTYVKGNPVTLSDPTGTRACDETGTQCAPPPLPPPPPPPGPPPTPDQVADQNGATAYYNLAVGGAEGTADSGLPIILDAYLNNVTYFNMANEWGREHGYGDLRAIAGAQAQALISTSGINWNATDGTRRLYIHLRGLLAPFTQDFKEANFNLETSIAEAAKNLENNPFKVEVSGDKVSLTGECSFAAQTVVMTKDGEKAIGKLKEGDVVLAYNPQTHEMEWQHIVHVWIHTDNDLVDLTISSKGKGQQGGDKQETSEVVHTNQKHPFFTIEKGFLTVKNISVGMHILRADGSIGEVTAWISVPGSSVMYNLEVERDHTFTVGEGQWIVHNCSSTKDYEGYFKTQRGTLGVLADQTEEGDTVTLDNIAIYGVDDHGQFTKPDIKDVLAARKELASEFKQQGFKTLRIRGLRVAGSSSANPGKEPDIVIDLTQDRW